LSVARSRLVFDLPPPPLDRAPTRANIAAYAKPIIGTTSKRGVEKWGLPYQRLGKACIAAGGWPAVQAHIRRMLAEAPVTGGKGAPA
jgi:hypothetical protein